MRYFKEITEWVDTSIPNHTYILNDAQQLVGYIKRNTTNEIIFSNPMKKFAKSRRKFREIKANNA
jgi:hypothetical protein